MKNTILLLFVFTSLVFAHSANALTVAIHPVEFSSIYSYQKDALLLDVTVTPQSADKTLTALTVKDMLGSSTASKFSSLTLWADAGAQGFQGWLQDTSIGFAALDNTGVWIFSPLAFRVQQSGVRLFVTGTAGQILNRRYLVQFGIPALVDSNSDGKYQTGDMGVFLEPSDVGPNELVVNSSMKELSPSVVIVPPQSGLISPSHGATVEKGSDLLIRGQARAAGGGPAVAVQLRWGPPATVSTAQWATVASASTVTDWQYRWKPEIEGDVVLETRALDVNGQAGASQAITVNVATPTPTPPDQYQGSLVRTSENSAVYYVYNGARWAFPNEKIFKSWYADFSTVKTVSAQQLAGWRLAGVVTYRPGVRLVKLQTDPKVYAVSKGGVLRWVSTEAAAIKLFGASWASLVDDLSDAFFPHYSVVEALTENSTYSAATEQAAATTIAVDKGLP